MKTTRLTKSTIVLNAPGSGPLGLLVVSHPEGEDPVARLRDVLGGSPRSGPEAVHAGGVSMPTWPQLASLIKSTDWSAHQLYIAGVESWSVLPVATGAGES